MRKDCVSAVTRNIRWDINVKKKELNVLVVSDHASEQPGESEENEVFFGCE